MCILRMAATKCLCECDWVLCKQNSNIKPKPKHAKSTHSKTQPALMHTGCGACRHGAYHAQRVTASSPIMPPVVRVHRDACLASSFNPIVLFGCWLPPTCTVVPFPVALPIGFCSDERNGLCQCHHNCILLITVDARYRSALCFAIVHGVLVVPLTRVVLETLVGDTSPPRRACCGRCGRARGKKYDQRYQVICARVVKLRSCHTWMCLLQTKTKTKTCKKYTF